MAAGDTVRDHQERCAPHLARLQMLAGGPGETPLRSRAVSQIIEAISAILGEVRAAGSSQFAVPDSPGRGSPGHVPLLAVRLTRLENAARQMVESALRGDAATLRAETARFEVLTAAMWTVQLSECAGPAVRPGRDRAALRWPYARGTRTARP
jgi:hypothetical protein